MNEWLKIISEIKNKGKFALLYFKTFIFNLSFWRNHCIAAKEVWHSEEKQDKNACFQKRCFRKTCKKGCFVDWKYAFSYLKVTWRHWRLFWSSEVVFFHTFCKSHKLKCASYEHWHKRIQRFLCIKGIFNVGKTTLGNFTSRSLLEPTRNPICTTWKLDFISWQASEAVVILYAPWKLGISNFIAKSSMSSLLVVLEI